MPAADNQSEMLVRREMRWEIFIMDFNTWIDEQEDDVREMLETHTAGLKTALTSERDAQKQLSADLAAAVASSAAGSASEGELRQKMEKITADLASAAGRADFYAAGHKAGVTNLSLAFLAAKESDLIGADGVDFEKLKTGYPELFAGVQRSPGNAGNGMAGDPPPSVAKTMDEIIRSQAGVTL